VTPDLLASPASKLALAVVTAPERAPAPPTGAREDALRHLLGTAADAGVTKVATRPEGDGERLLGQAWPFPSPFQVSVKTVSVSEGVDRVEARARRSLERLGLPRGETLLVSSAQDLAGADGRALWDRLQQLKARGLFRKIGVCARLDDGPVPLARRFEPDVIQLPCNLLDQRAHRTGVIAELAMQGVSVSLSSVFAGGALFAGGETVSEAWSAHAHGLSRLRRRLAEARIDPMQATLAYTLGIAEASQVTASVASAAELRAVLAAAHAPRPDLDWSSMALETAQVGAGAAPRLVSSAA